MIDTGAGVIDADYRGVVFVLLFNLSDQDFTGPYLLSAIAYSFLILTPTDHSTHGLACGFLILMQYWFVHRCVAVALDATVQEGDRIAQLIIEKIETPAVLEVDVRTLLFLGHRYRFVPYRCP